MNKEINDIFENNKKQLVDDLTKYVKARGNIECIPNTFYLQDEHLFPIMIEVIDDEVFVKYYSNKDDLCLNASMSTYEKQAWREKLSDFGINQLYQIFNCAVEVTQNEIVAMKQALDESLERERISQKIIKDLRKRLDNQQNSN